MYSSNSLTSTGVHVLGKSLLKSLVNFLNLCEVHSLRLVLLMNLLEDARWELDRGLDYRRSETRGAAKNRRRLRLLYGDGSDALCLDTQRCLSRSLHANPWRHWRNLARLLWSQVVSWFSHSFLQIFVLQWDLTLVLCDARGRLSAIGNHCAGVTSVLVTAHAVQDVTCVLLPIPEGVVHLVFL